MCEVNCTVRNLVSVYILSPTDRVLVRIKIPDKKTKKKNKKTTKNKN